MREVMAWRPGMPYSPESVAALLAEARRARVPARDAVEFLRAALLEAERQGDVECIRRILPMLAAMCLGSGAVAEAIVQLRRHRRLDESRETLAFLATSLSFVGFARAALRVERRALSLGYIAALSASRQATVETSTLPPGEVLAIHHDASRIRPPVRHDLGVPLILTECGVQARNVRPYAIRWRGEANDLLEVRRWRLDLWSPTADGRAFLVLARRLARKMNGVVFDPKNMTLWVSTSRVFTPERSER